MIDKMSAVVDLAARDEFRMLKTIDAPGFRFNVGSSGVTILLSIFFLKLLYGMKYIVRRKGEFYPRKFLYRISRHPESL